MDVNALEAELIRLRSIPVPPRPAVGELMERGNRRRRRRTIRLAVLAAVVLGAGAINYGTFIADDSVDVVANGPGAPTTGSALPAVGSVTVPDVVGQTLSAAVTAADDVGLSLGANEGDAAFANAVVVAIEPGAGNRLEPGGVIGARTALPDPPVDAECPSSRHPRDRFRSGADGLPHADALGRADAESQVILLRDEFPATSDTEIYLGVWDRWGTSPAGGAVGKVEGYQVIVITQDPSRCPSAPEFRNGVPVTHVIGPISDWAGSTLVPDLTDCGQRPNGSSPAVFDSSGGTYAAQAVAVEDANQLRFDIVQWLSGEDANQAYLRETGDDSGAPNDYFIVNESNQDRAARVADDAAVYVLRADGYASSLHAVSLRDVPTDEPERTFWLTFADGSITEICQQYRP